MKRRIAALSVFMVFSVAWVHGPSEAGGSASTGAAPAYASNQIIVRFRSEEAMGIARGRSRATAGDVQTPATGLQQLHRTYQLQEIRRLVAAPVSPPRRPAQLEERLALRAARAPEGGAQRARDLTEGFQRTSLLTFDGGVEVEELVRAYAQDPDVEWAEPNVIYATQLVPNDPFYHSAGSWGQPYEDLWGLHAIEAQNAWSLSTGEGVVVAVVDTGIDYNHPDIHANMWVNPGEIPGNGIDDDDNGCVDDVHGCDYVNADGDPLDVYVPHGTLWLQRGTVATGGFAGRWVVAGQDAQLSLQSGLGAGPPETAGLPRPVGVLAAPARREVAAPSGQSETTTRIRYSYDRLYRLTRAASPPASRTTARGG